MAESMRIAAIWEAGIPVCFSRSVHEDKCRAGEALACVIGCLPRARVAVRPPVNRVPRWLRSLTCSSSWERHDMYQPLGMPCHRLGRSRRTRCLSYDLPPVFSARSPRLANPNTGGCMHGAPVTRHVPRLCQQLSLLPAPASHTVSTPGADGRSPVDESVASCSTMPFRSSPKSCLSSIHSPSAYPRP